jgi:hypothetical protein
MTVSELIAALQRLPQEAEVILPFFGGEPASVASLATTTLIREHGPLAELREDLAPDQQVVVLYGHPRGEPGYDDNGEFT